MTSEYVENRELSKFFVNFFMFLFKYKRDCVIIFTIFFGEFSGGPQ